MTKANGMFPRVAVHQVLRSELDIQPTAALEARSMVKPNNAFSLVDDSRSQRRVQGQVIGSLPPGAEAHIFIRTLRDGHIEERLVATAGISGEGDFSAPYDIPTDGSRDWALQVKVIDEAGALVCASPPVFGPDTNAFVNLRVPHGSERRACELTQIEQRLEEQLKDGLAAITQCQPEQLEELAQWLGVPAPRLHLLQQACALQDQTHAPRALFFALGHARSTISLADIQSASARDLRTAVQEAVADHIVDESVLSGLDQHLARLIDLYLATEAERPPLWTMLEAADLPEETIKHVLGFAGGIEPESPTVNGTQRFTEGLDEDVAERATVALELGNIVGPDPALLRALHLRRQEGTWRSPKDLAQLDFDDWCELLESIQEADVGEDESLEEDSEDLWDDVATPLAVEDRAQLILEAFEDAYPSEFIHRELGLDEAIPPATRGFLQRMRNHDFLADSVHRAVATNPELLEGLAAEDAQEAVEHVAAVERVSRVTHKASEVSLLVGTGLRSATAIAGTPRRQFIALYGEAMGDRSAAARVHAQAQQVAAASKLEMVRLLQSQQALPLVLQEAAESVKAVPDAKTLFGSSGNCGCDHCASVYSPAAYFVDLLRYLSTPDPKGLELLRKRWEKQGKSPHEIESRLKARPLEVLLKRRPDLAELPLTCENTLTSLPYIDLVNEVLEARVVGASAAHDTGKTPADVLRAVPQFTNREAYTKMLAAVHPVSMPFHEPLEVARAYLGHLGVSRLELLTAFGDVTKNTNELVAEALGMSEPELANIVGTLPDLWRHFGFEAATTPAGTFVQSLATVPLFLQATGITFNELVELAGMRFLNADGKIVLVTPHVDCDPDKVTLQGFDEWRLARALRVLRVQRRLGWRFADLDRVLFALGALELDAQVLAKLSQIKLLATKLDRSVPELLVLWAPLDTWGKDNQFDRLLRTRAVAWSDQDRSSFALRTDGSELEKTGESLDNAASALLAAFRIGSDELARIRALLTKRGAEPKLDLAGISAIYRVVLLARALQLRVDQLEALLRLAPAQDDPFADPGATRRFLDIVADVQATDFTPERLLYLFAHEAELRRDPSPLPAQVQSVLASVRRALLDAYAETNPTSEATPEILQAKLALWLDPALVSTAMEALDPRSRMEVGARRAFFTRHLANGFADPQAAAERLFTEDGSGPPGEARWRANIAFVLGQILPQLRARQTRGAVVQTLADALGVSHACAARLLDEVLRSRRSSTEPLLADFLALVGTGLKGHYFANAELQGTPALIRTDADVAFVGGDSPVAPGLAPRQFSVRWTGYLWPRTKAEHTFYISTDAQVRLSLKLDDTDQVLIDHTVTGAAPGARPTDLVSRPVALHPGRLYELTLEYRNHGESPALALQLGTSPNTKQPIAATDLFDGAGLSSFAPVEQSYRRLHKAAMIIAGFGISDSQLEWLTSVSRFLDLDALPMAPPTDASPATLFHRWRRLAQLFGLMRKLPRSSTDLFDALRANSFNQAVQQLVLATGWERPVLEQLLERFGVSTVEALSPLNEPLVLLRLADAMNIQRRAGVGVATLVQWARSAVDDNMASAIIQAVKSRYDEKRWLEVARSLNDPLRVARRDALVQYLLPRMRSEGVKNRGSLFEYFLIDVEMSPCMLSSRVLQSISAVQTFFQRCLMNLENVPPRFIDDDDWKWMKSYRVWEANRKVFLYPENWIEPELRDDKSPLFEDLERAILQQEIKKENVEAAFADYLAGLDEIARLDVRAVWFERRARAPRFAQRPAFGVPGKPPQSEWDQGTYYIFARTFNAPHVWYQRRLDHGRTWTSWQKLDVDIDGEHLVPVMFQGRLHLFWTLFRETNKPVPPQNRKDEGPPPKLGKDWEIQLAYSVFDRGRWSRKRLSDRALRDDVKHLRVSPEDGKPFRDGSTQWPASAYTLRARVVKGQLQVRVFRRRAEPTLMWFTPAPKAKPLPFTGAKLSDTAVQVIGRFVLDGSQGALSLDGHAGSRENTSTKVIDVPAGYRMDAMGFARTRAAGALLALRSNSNAGTMAVLQQAPNNGKGARIVPVLDEALGNATLAPFFFQDRVHSYFARPVYTNWKAPRLQAVPVVVRPSPPPLPRFAKPRKPRRKRLFGAREDIEIADNSLDAAAEDAWEDLQDEAWHPDDGAEALRKKPRQAKPSAKARPAARTSSPKAVASARAAATQPARTRVVMTPGHHESQLWFTPFEHPGTAGLIRKLKEKGVEALLALSTTRPLHALDHKRSVSNAWQLRRPTTFEQQYKPGPLVDTKNPPHLDIDFDADNPYAAYNWELFFHAPLQVAIRLAKDGRHEEAQRWFHFIFDPTTDESTPAPQRYWRFAPFHENKEFAGASQLASLLSKSLLTYAGEDRTLIHRQKQAVDQLSAWWEKPFSPHVIARLRIVAYQKAVVMKYIDNLIEWGDKLFRRDSMESIHEATQLYILAANILGPRPERVPPIADRKPVTFAQINSKVDPFANWEVRLENEAIRRPFKISAQPDIGAAGSVLGMVTQYFCVPSNPQLEKYWDTVADRLFKIRNCMNIAGVVRQLALFEPPIDPSMLIRAAAAGVDLGSVISNLNAPPLHYRFKFLMARALRLAEELRSFGSATLRVLEHKDAEALASLRANNEAGLVDAVREIRKKQLRQIEEELAGLALEREHIELQVRHINTQMQDLLNPQEVARQKSLTASQVIAGVSEGIDLVSKVLYAIPDFQTGAAGGFSSPFATVQLGGQMFGDISAAFATSLEKVMSRNETEAEMAATMAEYQRRREEWQHELELLGKDKAKIEKKLAETQLKFEISAAELRRQEVELENARKVERHLRDKFTNEQLYGWMLGQVSTAYFQAYKFAFDAALQAERGFRFERGDSASSFIEFSYWDSLKKGLFAGERLLIDLRRMENAHIEGDRRSLEVTRHISLRADFPASLQELLATGKCEIDVTEALLDGDFPGHHFRRIKTVSLSVLAPHKPYTNVNCTLTMLQNKIRVSPNGSGSYAHVEETEDARFVINISPVQAIATSRPQADAGLFELRFDDDRYLPFEGAGAIAKWRIELDQANNTLALTDIDDLVLSLSYTARAAGGSLEAAARSAREKGLSRGGLAPAPQYQISLKRDLPTEWKRFKEAPAGQDVQITLPLGTEQLSGRYRALDVRVERVTALAQAKGRIEPEALRVRLEPPKGASLPMPAWATPWPGAPTLRSVAEITGAAGPWALVIAAPPAKTSALLDDVVFIFELRARKQA
ncbi:MAG: neuraminidase-like domain-containing protein [Deltaproteobacteria bacterium]|nr:neuraminidase-like domain-containing protein [Deltaproteobacteria bacterium]